MKAAVRGTIMSMKATTALAQNRCVGVTGTYVADVRPVGVTVKTYGSGDMAALQIDGICVVEAGGQLTAGGLVKVDSNGKVVAFAMGGTYAATDVPKIAGMTLDDASGDGVLVRVKLL